jgi:hypothetical protein
MAISLKKILGAVAPSLATALGGPLAGTAVAAIAKKVLGKDAASEDEIAAVLQTADPAMLLKLKELDAQFKSDMAKLGVELDRIELEDRKDARAMHVATKDWMPNALAGILMLGLGACAVVLMNHSVPPDNKEIIVNLMGVLEGAAVTVFTFYFGSSRSSSEKDKVIGRIAES